MADMLHLSPKTIYAYRVRIKEKMQLRDGNELGREAMRWIESAGKWSQRTTPRPDDDGIAAVGDAMWFR
jgi:hypothetical protein